MFEVTLLVAALLVSLVAGLLLVFAIVVMPGLGTLGDLDYLRAFKAIDRVIQDSQPVFVLVWAGSVVAVVAAGVFAVTTWSGSVRLLVLAAVGIYLLGVQLSTFVNNIPLNNQLQRLDLDMMTTDELSSERAAFEPNWNRWNRSRTIFATVSSIMLLAAIAQL